MKEYLLSINSRNILALKMDGFFLIYAGACQRVKFSPRGHLSRRA